MKKFLVLKIGGGGGGVGEVKKWAKKTFSSKENIAGQQVHGEVVSVTSRLGTRDQNHNEPSSPDICSDGDHPKDRGQKVWVWVSREIGTAIWETIWKSLLKKNNKNRTTM